MAFGAEKDRFVRVVEVFGRHVSASPWWTSPRFSTGSNVRHTFRLQARHRLSSRRHTAFLKALARRSRSRRSCTRSRTFLRGLGQGTPPRPISPTRSEERRVGEEGRSRG